MEETFDAFIIRRRRELAEAEAPLRQQLAEIAAERKKIDIAALAISAETTPPPFKPPDCQPQLPEPTATTPPDPEPPPLVIKRSQRRPNRVSTKTMKAAIETVLQEFPQGLTALEILPKLNAILGTDYPRTSLSPQLSRLKGDKRITLDGSIWRSEVRAAGADLLGEPAPRGDPMT